MGRLLREYFALDHGKNIIEEAKKARVDNSPLTMKAILQRADVLNQNGRKYPRAILEREVGNYKSAIAEGRSGGQMDHPDCIQKGSRILTKDGWKDFKDITENEYVYTLSPKTDKIELQKIRKKIDQPYNGKMYHIKGRNINTMVTPNHRFLLVDRRGNKSFVSVSDIYENRTKYSHSHIPKLGNWDSPVEQDEFFTLPGIRREDNRTSEKYENELKINLSVWTSFLGIYLSEGCANRAHGKGYLVKITQKKEEVKTKIRNLLAQFPDEITWREYEFPDGDGKVDFCTNDGRLHAYLSVLGRSYEKYIPYEVKLLPSCQLENLLEWFLLGDGRTRKCEGYEAKEVFSTSKRLIDDLSEILIKSGGSGNTYIRKPYDRYIQGRLIKEENQRDLHFLHFSTTKGIYLNKDFLSIEEVDYNDRVYCVSVPNETFYCMDNGKTFWSGNSSIVELQQVSHTIKDIWWEGDDVIGTIEIHPSLPLGPKALGLLEAGMRVGISSRGVGETMQDDEGNDVVDESFMLVAFDLVSEPSTHEAWLMKEGKEIDMNMFRRSIPKAERISRLIREILGERK